MKVICVTRLFGFISLFNIFSVEFNTDGCIKNVSDICDITFNELSYWETIQDVFIILNLDELRDI